MFCRKCGKELKENGLFCPGCGERVVMPVFTETTQPSEAIEQDEPVEQIDSIGSVEMVNDISTPYMDDESVTPESADGMEPIEVPESIDELDSADVLEPANAPAPTIIYETLEMIDLSEEEPGRTGKNKKSKDEKVKGNKQKEKHSKDKKHKEKRKLAPPSTKQMLIIIIVSVAILGVVALLLIAGLMKKKPVSETVNIEEATDDKVEIVDPEGYDKGDDTEEEQESVDDPLADYNDVTFIGDMSRDDNVTRTLVAKLIEEKGVNPAEILSVCCSDFEKDDTCEAFIFVGIYNDGDDEEYAEKYYEGSCYYVSDSEIVQMELPQSEIWEDTGALLDFDQRQYFCINEHYTTGMNTELWTVRNGKLTEENVSRCGALFKSDNKGYEIVTSEYDNMYDRDMQGTLGHTWKHYYCDYDKDADAFIEYAGSEIDITDVDAICDEDIVSRLFEEDKYLMNAYLRGNGIINVNYLSVGDYDVEFSNANYNYEKGCFVEANDYEEGDLAKANYGGIYYAACTGADQIFPEDPPIFPQKECDIMIASNNNLLDMGNYQILYGLLSDEFDGIGDNRALIVDEDTVLANGLGGGASAMEWLKVLANPTEEMLLNGEFLMGVFGLTVSGSHVDSIDGQYWWD